MDGARGTGREGVPAAVGFEPSLVRRPPRATAPGRGTSTVADLRRQVDGALHAGFPHRIWVSGRVGRTGEDPEGDLLFRLHSSTDDEPFWVPCVVPAEAVPGVRDLCERVHDADVEDVVAEGRLARVGGLLRYDFAANRLVLLVSELDPTPTALGLQEERELAREHARAAGLGVRQRARTLRAAPLRVTLVAPPRDPAAARVRALLQGSGFAVDVRDCPVPVHGVQAPTLVAAAVREAAVRSDLVLLLREQGRPLGLGVFDADPVVRALGDAPVPVVTGLGGQGTATASDDVAFLALDTADEAGQWALERLQDAERALRELGAEVEVAAGEAAERARDDLARERAAVEEAAQAAYERAQARERRRTRLLLALAALAVAAVVAAAVTTRRPGMLLVLPALLLAAVAARSWSTWARGRPAPASGGSRMAEDCGSGQDEFAQVLAHLRDVRQQLAGTSSPERVSRLRLTADELLARGQAILGRHVPSAPRPPGADPTRSEDSGAVSTGSMTAGTGTSGTTAVVQPAGDPQSRQPIASGPAADSDDGLADSLGDPDPDSGATRAIDLRDVAREPQVAPGRPDAATEVLEVGRSGGSGAGGAAPTGADRSGSVRVLHAAPETGQDSARPGADAGATDVLPVQDEPGRSPQ